MTDYVTRVEGLTAQIEALVADAQTLIDGVQTKYIEDNRTVEHLRAELEREWKRADQLLHERIEWQQKISHALGVKPGAPPLSVAECVKRIEALVVVERVHQETEARVAEIEAAVRRIRGESEGMKFAHAMKFAKFAEGLRGQPYAVPNDGGES